jgi:hypothetical protein
MLRIALLAVAGVLLVGCTVSVLTGAGGDRPGPIVALLLGMLVAGGGFILRKRPGV